MKKPPTPPDESARLEALRSTRLLDTEPDIEFDDIAQIASHICGTPIALISLVDDHRQWFKARVGLGTTQTPRDVAFCAHAIVDRGLLVVPDALDDVRFADNPLVVGEPHVRFYAGAPLLTPEGHSLGTLCVLDRVPRALASEQLRTLEALARQVMLLICLRRKTDEAYAATSELTRASAAIAQSEQRFRLLTEQSHDVIGRLEPNGKIIYVSPAIRRMLGYEPAELVGRSFDEFVHPDDLADVAAGRAAVARGEMPAPTLERRLRARDGRYVWTESTRSFVRDGNGAVIEIHASARDVTARRAAEDARREIEAQKNQLVATVSHELRTPLTAIQGALGLVATGVMGALPAEAVTMIDVARSNCDRLVRLVSDMLDLERIQAGKFSLRIARTTARELIETTIAPFGPSARASRVSLRLDVACGDELWLDGDRIVQVLTNLVSNALKFAPADSEVSIDARSPSEGRVRFSVADSGAGIGAEEQRLLFRPYQQLEGGTSTRGGTGLGLAISKAIVEQHGGTIGVDSAVGRGSKFWFDVTRDVRPVGARDV